MADVPATPTLPISKALLEASSDSLAELMSRDPEGYTEQDLGVIVAEMRAQRERIAASDAAAGGKPRAKAKGPAPTLDSKVGLGDLDL